MKDIKVMDTLRELNKETPPFHPLAFFAETVAMTRDEPGLSIEEIGKCFRAQFDESELECLVAELNKGKL